MNVAETEKERLAELDSYLILDTAEEKAFDDIATLASIICQTPVSMISFLDHDRQWFKSKVGVAEAQTSREVAFCSHTILDDDLMIVTDASKDKRFSKNPLVRSGPQIRFYAGIPLVTSAGHKLGTICVIDFKSRTLNDEQKFALNVLRDQVINLLELRKKNMELEKLHATNKKLLSIIGHDLRGPLNALSALVGLAEKSVVDESEFRGQLPAIKKLLESNSELLNSLLTWAKSEVVGVADLIDPINYWELVQGIIDANRHHFDCKGNQVINNIPEHARGLAHREMVTFVFRNLILNACKFSREGSITLSGNIIGNELIFSVADSGVGVEDAEVDLFSWRKGRSTPGTDGEIGSGLGLPMCKEFILIHKGRIWYETSKGRGSTFYFSLPVSES